ncbi:MAG: hypothetical protein B6D44_02215 [Ignavibacteriales bacterium UTCHB2]|jgi:SAM-dependent methyltransferase|nr:MAG: hypothetical protein B6D44_02215 [Ignavibacteriales bacterium UTCHB2]HQI41319.1 class I SAM-dependent methyltransferase [Ignavibacteriaceae bacterium]
MCPVCNQTDYNVLGNPLIDPKVYKIIKKNFKIAKCNNCKTYFVTPQIDFTKEEWQYLYDSTYFPPLSKYYPQKRLTDAKDRLNVIEKCSAMKIQKFLDVGCGEGYTIIEAVKKGWTTFGVDITDHRIDGAKEATNMFFNADLLEANLESDFFDVVYLDSVLEHVPNPLEYLKEIYRVLKHGGIAYIGVPNEDSLLNDIRKIIFKIFHSGYSEKIKPFQSPYHINGFNKKSLSFIIDRANFKIEILNNFASKFEFLKVQPFTKEFFQLLLLLPIYLVAIPFRKEVYLEAYIKK